MNFKTLFVAGHSLSTCGEPNDPQDPNATTWHGSSSNGPTWPLLLCEQLKIPYVKVNNKAVGGAPLSTLQAQVDSFQITDPTTALVGIWNWSFDPAEEGIIPHAILSLYSRGIRTIILPNVPDSSSIVPSPTKAQIISYNTAMQNAISHVPSSLIRLLYVDVFSLWEDVGLHPQNYNIAYPFKEGYLDPLFVNGRDWTVGENYIMWHLVHPTSKLHRLLATAMMTKL
jgi:hypothetical protein